MHPYTNRFQSSLANGLQGPQRASTGPSPLAGTHHALLSEQALASGKTLGAALEDYASLPEHIEEDDFEEISYDELRLSLCPADPAHFAPVFGEFGQYHTSLRELTLDRCRLPASIQPHASIALPLVHLPPPKAIPSFPQATTRRTHSHPGKARPATL